MAGRGLLLPSYVMTWRDEDAEGEAWLTKKEEGTLQCISNRELFDKSNGMDPTRSPSLVKPDLLVRCLMNRAIVNLLLPSMQWMSVSAFASALHMKLRRLL